MKDFELPPEKIAEARRGVEIADYGIRLAERAADCGFDCEAQKEALRIARERLAKVVSTFGRRSKD